MNENACLLVVFMAVQQGVGNDSSNSIWSLTDQLLNHLSAELAQLLETAGVIVGQAIVVEPE